MSKLTPTRPVEYSDEYKAGFQAYENGLTMKACPFLKDTSSYDRWVKGWSDALADAESQD